MGRLLVAWEFGGGLGHVRRVQALARELRALGHSPAVAFRDTAALAAPLAEGFDVYAAPRLRPPEHPNRAPVNFADILLNQGYDDGASLQGALEAWRNLFALDGATALVADDAPTATLAARAAGLRVASVGSGFALPPGARPWPSIRPWDRVAEPQLAERDARLWQRVSEALGRSAARELLQADLDLLCTFEELDPFGPREATYLGPVSEDGGLAVAWRGDARPRIFAYLKPEDPRSLPLVRAMASAAGEAIVAMPGAPAETAAALSSEAVRVFDQPIRLEPLLAQADLCVSHGGPGLAARALLDGVPLAIVPGQLEQFHIARRLEALGAGVSFAPDRPDGELGAWLASSIARDSMREAALGISRKYRGFSAAHAAREAARRIAAALA